MKYETSQELRKLPYTSILGSHFSTVHFHILSFLPMFTFASLDKVLMASMRL